HRSGHSVGDPGLELPPYPTRGRPHPTARRHDTGSSDTAHELEREHGCRLLTRRTPRVGRRRGGTFRLFPLKRRPRDLPHVQAGLGECRVDTRPPAAHAWPRRPPLLTEENDGVRPDRRAGLLVFGHANLMDAVRRVVDHEKGSIGTNASDAEHPPRTAPEPSVIASLRYVPVSN